MGKTELKGKHRWMKERKGKEVVKRKQGIERREEEIRGEKEGMKGGVKS